MGRNKLKLIFFIIVNIGDLVSCDARHKCKISKNFNEFVNPNSRIAKTYKYRYDYSANVKLSINNTTREYPLHKGDVPKVVYEFKEKETLIGDVMTGLVLYYLGRMGKQYKTNICKGGELCKVIAQNKKKSEEALIDCVVSNPYLLEFGEEFNKSHQNEDVHKILPNGTIMILEDDIPEKDKLKAKESLHPHAVYTLLNNGSLLSRGATLSNKIENDGKYFRKQTSDQIQAAVDGMTQESKTDKSAKFHLLPNGTLLNPKDLGKTESSKDDGINSDVKCYFVKLSTPVEEKSAVSCDLLLLYAKQLQLNSKYLTLPDLNLITIFILIQYFWYNRVSY